MKQERYPILMVPTAGPQMIMETTDPKTFVKCHAANRRTNGVALFNGSRCLYPGLFDAGMIRTMEETLARPV